MGAALERAGGFEQGLTNVVLDFIACERKQASLMSRNPSYSQKFVFKNVQSCVSTNVVFF